MPSLTKFLQWYGGLRTCCCCNIRTCTWILVCLNILISTGALANFIYLTVSPHTSGALDDVVVFISFHMVAFTLRLIAALFGAVGLIRHSPRFILLFWIVYIFDVAVLASGAVANLITISVKFGLLGLLSALLVIALVLPLELVLTGVIYSYYLVLKAEKLQRTESKIAEEHAALIEKELDTGEDEEEKKN